MEHIISKIKALAEPVDLLFAYHYPGVDCVLTAMSGDVTLFKEELTTDDSVYVMVELTKIFQNATKSKEVIDVFN